MKLIKVINNVSERVVDDLKTKLSEGSRVSIAAASFSIYAFEALKEELENVDELRFIFTSPTFIKDKVKKEKLFSDYSKVYEFVHNLNWTHIRRLLSVVNSEARMWYLKYASEEMWSTTTHNRNISSQYLIRGQKRVVDLTYFASFLVTMQWRMLLRHIFSTPRGKIMCSRSLLWSFGSKQL